MDTKEGRGDGMDWETGIDIYTVLCIKQVTNENHGYSTRNLNGKEIQGRGCVCVCVCVCVADSLCSTVETDIAVKATTLQLRNIKWDEGLSYRTEPLTCGI